MARDICPLCGAWLILAEVQYVSPDARSYRDTGSCLVYECPACHSVFERWMRDDESLLPMPPRGCRCGHAWPRGGTSPMSERAATPLPRPAA